MATVDLDKGSGKNECHTLRISCRCRDLSHSLDISVSNEWGHEIDVNTAEHTAFHYNLWGKIKAAFRILVGKSVCLGGICVSDEDLRDVAKFIKKHVGKMK